MIFLTLPVPPSANAYWGIRLIWNEKLQKKIPMVYVTKEGAAYKKTVENYVKACGIWQPLPGRVWIDIQLYPGRPQDWARRQRKDPANWDDTIGRIDLDNARKCLYDALKGCVFGDDKMVFKDSGEVQEPDEHSARVEVTIRQIVRKTAQQSLDIEALPPAPLPPQQQADEPAF